MSTFVRQPCDEGVVRAAAECPPCGRRHSARVLTAAILGSSMAFVDGTVVNVMLPALQASLGATVTEIQWVVEAYTLVLAAGVAAAFIDTRDTVVQAVLKEPPSAVD